MNKEIFLNHIEMVDAAVKSSNELCAALGTMDIDNGLECLLTDMASLYADLLKIETLSQATQDCFFETFWNLAYGKTSDFQYENIDAHFETWSEFYDFFTRNYQYLRS